MGRTVKPKYVIILRDNLSRTASLTPIAQSRKLTAAGLEKYRQSMNRSYQEGGANYHISVYWHKLVHCHYAKLCLNNGQEIPIVEAKAPMFEIIEPMRKEKSRANGKV